MTEAINNFSALLDTLINLLSKLGVVLPIIGYGITHALPFFQPSPETFWHRALNLLAGNYGKAENK
jgi:hypothetical protein